MRAVMLEVPESFLDERRRRGHDRFDEMWEGVLHMVPAPSDRHQRLGGRLHLILAPLAERRGLVASYETGLYRAGDDYKVPDLVFTRPQDRSERGVEGRAELVVEIRSPGDETYQKIEWYLAAGVRRVVVIDRDSLAVELFWREGTASEALGVSFETLPGPRLRLAWDVGEAEVAV